MLFLLLCLGEWCAEGGGFLAVREEVACVFSFMVLYLWWWELEGGVGLTDGQRLSE